MQTMPLDITAWPPKTEAMSMTVTPAPLRAPSNAAHSPEMAAPTVRMSLGRASGSAPCPRMAMQRPANEIKEMKALSDLLISNSSWTTVIDYSMERNLNFTLHG